MQTNYNEIRKLFNYYIREYYYQKSKGSYFVHFKKPGILFMSLKCYKRKKMYYPCIYDWYFDNLNNVKKNKDIFQYKNEYNIKNIYSHKICREKENIEKNNSYVETDNIYLNKSEEELQNIYKSSNLYYNINPIYLSKICLYNLNEYHILYSNNYYDAFTQYYYSLITYKMDVHNIKIFPNLKILISHIKNISNIINDEVIKNAYIYLIKQKNIMNEEYLKNVFRNIYATMLHNSPMYLFVDNLDQFIMILKIIKTDDIKCMFESVIPYPYYLIVDENINIYNLQSFNIYINSILNQRMQNNYSFNEKEKESILNSYNDDKMYIIYNNNINQSKDIKIEKQTQENEKVFNSILDTDKGMYEKNNLKNKNDKIYFFKFIKIFDMKPNYRFKQKN
ncbi:conserved Plasmodium protein, unknown function [Plasmodium sp. DRC-Itaito]|nr:conserved Plasmodium protein, unknown function [Plasmodium sp. DRC-Itaito]